MPDSALGGGGHDCLLEGVGCSMAADVAGKPEPPKIPELTNLPKFTN